MSICLIDTSVFCNIVGVPNKAQDRHLVLLKIKQHIESKVTLLLPMASIVETGNHVAQQGDGTLRRRAAERFVRLVKDALNGTAPWTPTPFIEAQQLYGWLSIFPDHAMRGVGIGDLSIIKEWERQCALHPLRRVFIWSMDADLAGWDRV